MPALAESQFTCVDDDSLNEFAQFTINGNGFEINETVTCPHGCSDDFARCKPAPFTSSIIGFTIIFILGFLMAFILNRINDNTNLGFAKLSIIPLVFFSLGFVDIFNPYIRILFAVFGLFSIITIILVASWVKKDGSMAK